MPENIKHTLNNLEIAPPGSAWEGISAQLDKEFDAGETRLAQKLETWEATPPSTAWTHIAAALPLSAAPAQPAKVIAFPFRKVAAAAVLIGLVSVAVWFYFSSNGKLALPQAVAPNTAATIPAAVTPLPDHPPVVAHQQNIKPSQPAIARYERPVNNPVKAVSYMPDNQVVTAVNLPYSGLDDVRPVTRTASPNVAAPPIRDANGNIILDTDLIRADDNNNYIVVTGPNGQQTRISSKFLHVLSSLNADIEPYDYFDFMIRENNLWKIRFHEWRNKLLQQASFIPTPTNFLDILELKDMLQEN